MAESLDTIVKCEAPLTSKLLRTRIENEQNNDMHEMFNYQIVQALTSMVV